MKENKYNDQKFFDKYASMNRSQNGLKAAGEWFALEKILPNFNNKVVLDLGCGYGWHCKYVIEKGAAKVIGVDISSKMLEIAKQKNNDAKIDYQCSAIENLDFPINSFDIIFSSLTFHYVQDFDQLIKNISKWIKKDGQLIFSVEHPVFTSKDQQDWHYDVKGDIMHFPVDNYYYEGKREAVFLEEKIVKYHRTLTTYLNTLIQNRFELNYVIEPIPQKEMLEIEDMKNEMRRPMMLIVSARKKVG